MTEYAISIKKPEWRRAKLLGFGGSITTLRVHAVRFAALEAAENVAKEIMDTNDGIDASGSSTDLGKIGLSLMASLEAAE